MAGSSRQRILDGALDILRAEGAGTITLDGTAKQVGLTKPGLMYHFPTKEALMLAVVDHVAQRWERLMLDHLGQPLAQASARQRIRTYVEVALKESFDCADFVVFADAVYDVRLTAAWTRRFEPWLALPDDVSASERGRLTAARLLADGFWMAAATGVFAAAEQDRAELFAVADNLLTETDSP